MIGVAPNDVRQEKASSTSFPVFSSVNVCASAPRGINSPVKEVPRLNSRAMNMANKLTQEGGVFNYGPALSRFLITMVRLLAKGKPVSSEQVHRNAVSVGLAEDEADEFLTRRAERDAEGNIVGLMGLSLKNHPHRFFVDDAQLTTWCAEDTLFLPAVLGQTVRIESESPVTKMSIRLTAGPKGVLEIEPRTAVVSVAILDPERVDMNSAQAVWGNFCHHVFFFSDRDEALAWSNGRDDIEILSVDEAYEFGQSLCSSVLSHVEPRRSSQGGPHGAGERAFPS